MRKQSLIADKAALIRAFTPRRSWNAVKVLSSYYWSRITRKPIQWGKPISLSIEPTTACNLQCPECPSGLRQFSRPTGRLRMKHFKPWIDQLAPHTAYLTFYFQGEPYLNPDFLDMVAYAKEKGLYTATSTNAHFITQETAEGTVESGLDRLIISIDGTTQEVYEQYRREGQLEKVLEGTKQMVAARKRLKSKSPHLIFQFLVVRPNEHQVEEVYRLAEELGVDEVKLKTAQVYEYENGNPLIPEQEQYSRYKRQAKGTYELKNKLLNHCWRLWHTCVITWDGKVVPCCFDKDASHPMGSLAEQDFDAIWRGPAYRNFRSALLKSRNEIDICQNCTEGTKVWA